MADLNPLGEGPVTLVSSAWVMARLEEGSIQIVDCQPNVHDYIQEHLPRAVYVNEGLFRSHEGGHPARWVAPEAIRPVLNAAGLEPETPVVVYTGVGVSRGWGEGLGQTMVAYSLARYGHRCVHVLDGGIDRWKAEGRPLSQAFPVPAATSFPVSVRRDYGIGHEELVRIKDLPGVVLLDARPPALYEGKGPWVRPGHIPGAVNLPWARLMDPDNRSLLKPLAEIEFLLQEKGVSRDKTIVCSCGTGREATNEFLLLRFYLGFPDVRIHEGAFTEWVSDPANPTVTGKNPR